MTTALIISTYNWKKALSVVLKSILKLSITPNEIFIADDGSESSTKKLIDQFKVKHPHINLFHIWHEDKGHRKSRILNKCLKTVKSDYIIQIDGDCIMHKHFIKDHILFAKENQFICANRTMLTKTATSFILCKENIHSLILNLGSKLHLKYQYRNYKLAKKRSSLLLQNKKGVPLGCNISYWKKDALLVNGYNELFSGWGPEDAEFAQRLINCGRKCCT